MASAGAVRQGRVYVEIGADTKGVFAAFRRVNEQIGRVGDVLSGVGKTMLASGAAITAPILALGGAMISQTAEMKAMQAAILDVGNAVGEAIAPAMLGMTRVITGAAKAVAKFIRENQQLVRAVFLVGGYLSAWGAAALAVGSGMSMLSRGVAASLGPLASFAQITATAVSAIATFAVSGPVLAAVAVIAGIGVGAARAGVDLLALAKTVGSAFAAPFGQLTVLFGDLLGTASLTIDGIYRAISAGDLMGAVDVLWAGWQAAWARGQQAVMGTLDPWTEEVQNTLTDLGTGIAAWWDQTWTDLATSEWGGVILGAMDNVVNAMMAAWDNGISFYQKSWARFSAWWSGDVEKMQKEFARIDAANAANAEARGKARPGLEGRTNLTDQQKADMQAETARRQAAMWEDAQAKKKERRARTEANVATRAEAVGQANRNLRDQVNRFPEPPPIKAPGAKLDLASAGTFSAFGLGGMGTGGIQKEQLDELKRIRDEIKAQGMGVGP